MEPKRTDEDRGEAIRCPACGRTVPRADAKVCPTCRRRVCVACLKPYGHHMRVCDECALGDW
jgi:hypothetical protein